MGVDAADFDEDGWQDLFVANLDREMFAIYHNNHDETFDDLAGSTGIAKATHIMSGWGLKFFDYDNDGNLDLFLANGNPDDLIKSLHGESHLRRAVASCFTTPGNRSKTSARKAARLLPRRFRHAAWPLETLTMMARSTS